MTTRSKIILNAGITKIGCDGLYFILLNSNHAKVYSIAVSSIELYFFLKLSGSSISNFSASLCAFYYLQYLII